MQNIKADNPESCRGLVVNKGTLEKFISTTGEVELYRT